MQGQIINGFVLKKLLGRGGMAEVWYAENEIGKSAAVKILNESLSNNQQIVERFHNEALVMVKLDHPHIRQVYGYGYLGNRHCIVMEYLEGQDLEELLKRGRRFTDEELRRWWNQTVEALNYTHAMNIVHRDIKPSNLFLDKRGNIKLLDFGIAKVRESISMTRTGALMGTLMYMSPEQVKDTKNIDYHTDVYSLAVTFIHLVSGISPYDSETTGDFEIREQIVYKPLDLSGLPEFWQTTLAPYLEKEPSKRPALQPIVEPKKMEATTLDEDKTVEEGEKQKQEQATPDTVLNSDAEPAKRKPSVVPWIIAGVAFVAAVLAWFLGGGHGNSNNGLLANLNDGMQSVNVTLSNKIAQRYAAFEEYYGMDREKVGPYWEQAQNLREEGDALVSYLESLKWNLVKKAEGKDANMALTDGVLKSADTIRNGRRFFDLNVGKLKTGNNEATDFMLGNPEGPGNGGKAYELSEKVRKFRDSVVNAVGSEHEHEIGLISDDGGPTIKDGWEYRNFHNASLVDDITLLNKITTEVQTAELNAVNQLMQNANATDFTFDEVGARVFAESGYLLSGQTYRAQAMVTAWKNSQLTARVKLDGGAEKEYTSNAQGVIPLEWNVGVGSHKYTGVIDMLDPTTNQMGEFPFAGSFTVAPPAVSVSATKMNVVYRGIDNPIAVGGGVGGEINASASSGTLTRMGNGTYNLRPGEANEVTISVTSGGSSLGSMKFRVKDLPKPTAIIRNVVNGQVSKNALLAANRVEAEMKDFDFDGVHYDVVGYTMTYKTPAGTVKETKANSGAFTSEVKTAINQANVGDMFVFSGIQVRGNDGKTKTIETPIGVIIK